MKPAKHCDLMRDNTYIKNWISIRKADNCLFSRRNGLSGKIIL